MKVSFIGVFYPEEIVAGLPLMNELLKASKQAGFVPSPGVMLIVKLKAVSKSLGLWMNTEELNPSPLAHELAQVTGKDLRLIEAVLRHSRRVVRAKEGVLIVETKSGIVCANAMLDRSNTGRGPEWFLCPPKDIDAEAKRLGTELSKSLGFHVPVILSDTLGRPFRLGQADTAVGLWGLEPFLDLRGQQDGYGTPLKDTCIALADEVAAGAELACGKTRRMPFVWVEGLSYTPSVEASAKDLIRPPVKNLFP